MRNTCLLLFLLISFFKNETLKSQCLNTITNSGNEGGYFDASNWNSSHWWTTNSEGTISRDTEDFYYGSGSLKVAVSSSDDYNNDAVRIWTRTSNCGIEISNNQSWNVSFYIKGEVGDIIQFKLIDSDNSYITSIGV